MPDSHALRRQLKRPHLIIPISGLIAVGLIIWLIFGSRSATPQIVVQNVSRNPKICLIYDSSNSTTSSAAWSGIQSAAQNILINAQRLRIPHHSGTRWADPYINSLVQRHCTAIISGEPDFMASIASAARRNPHQQFVNTGTPVRLRNVVNISPRTAAIESSVIRLAREKIRD